MGVDTVGDVMHRMRYGIVRDNQLLNHYAAFVVTTIAACMNAAVNPVLYYLRLKPFQKFVRKLVQKVRENFRDIQQNVLELRSSGLPEEKIPPVIQKTNDTWG